MPINTTKSDASPLAYAMNLGTHVVLTDVSRELGGLDAGPDPHDLFDASLAACTSLTVTMYAQRKGWPLQDVQVTVTRDASAEKSGVYRLHRDIHFVGDLDPGQRERLMEIADKCPIHKLMHTSIDITSSAT